MRKCLYITGGRQNLGTTNYDERRCNAALLLKLDVSSLSVSKLIEYVTPLEYRADEAASVLFKAGQLKGNYLYLCTTTEVLVYNRHTLEQLHHITHPYFNDIHHVLPGPGSTVIVVSTGLDAMFQVTMGGEIIQEWSLTENNIWERFDKDCDYRKVLSTKPHDVHPNFGFYIDNELYCNCSMQQKAVCVTNQDIPSFEYGMQLGHDGIVRGDKVYFTTVNGYLVAFDACSKEKLFVVNLNEISNEDCALGWCRGIELLDDDRVIVGFSRLRPTKWKENISWVKWKFALTDRKPELPTRITCVNIKSRLIEWSVNLEDSELGEVFSIHLAED